jgi:hypothetical protein
MQLPSRPKHERIPQFTEAVAANVAMQRGRFAKVCSVKSGKAQSEQMFSGLAPTPDIQRRG